jgi:hypothetical protein
VAVCVTVTLSLVSVAVKTSAAAVVDVTVNVTTPESLLGPDAALIVGEPEPEVLASVTVLPETGLLSTSFKVTVIVEVVEPSAVTEVGEADTDDCSAEATPSANALPPRSSKATIRGMAESKAKPGLTLREVVAAGLMR